MQELVHGQGLCEVEALEDAAAESGQGVGHLLVLDALGGDLDAEGLEALDDGGQQFVGLVEIGADEAHVELDVFERELQHAHEVGVAGAEVVEREDGALRDEHVHVLLQALLIGERRLGDLEAEAVDGHLVALRDAAEVLSHVAVATLDGREVEVQAGFLEDLLAELRDAAAALGDGDEDVGPNEAELLVVEACEYLRPDDAALLCAVERLEVDLDGVRLDGAIDGAPDRGVQAGLVEERLLHDDDIVLLFGAVQSRGCVVEEQVDALAALQLALEHRVAGRQVEVRVLVDPRSLHARIDLLMDLREGGFLRREQDEAPHGRVDDLAVGKRRLEVARDGAQSFRHLPLVVERAALRVIVDADGKGGEGPALIELLQVRRSRQVAQRPRLAVEEDVGVLECEVLDEDGQHVEGVHDEVGRGVHAHDVADAEHEPRPHQRELLDARPSRSTRCRRRASAPPCRATRGRSGSAGWAGSRAAATGCRRG